MNLKKQIEEKKLKDIKERTRPVDALPLAKFMIDAKDKLTQEQKDVFLNRLHKDSEKIGEILIERCFIEKIMDEKEYLEIKEKYKLEPTDFASILQAYFNSKDGLFKADDEVIVVATSDASVIKARDFIKEKFNVKVITPEEAIKLIENDKNKRKKSNREKNS